MYEPIRTKSVHTMAGTAPSDFPHRSREEELDIQLAGHLAALLAVTDEIRSLAPSPRWTRPPSGSRSRWPGCGRASPRSAPRPPPTSRSS